jgi:hypothetical protein
LRTEQSQPVTRFWRAKLLIAALAAGCSAPALAQAPEQGSAPASSLDFAMAAPLSSEVSNSESPFTTETPVQQSPSAPATAPTPQAPQLPDAPKPHKPPQISKKDCKNLPCPVPFINWYLRFEDGPQVKPLTPMEKGWLATKSVIDPFNIITILGTDAISVAADSHSAYGPGFPGWGRNVGVSFSEDVTGEFFGTFLIPTIVHQDPHYHRMPHASYKRRIFHAIDQVVWTQGDNGKGMLNYADLVGFGIDDEIANLYVPGRETNGPATAQRYGIALATAPIDNFISEFLPDVAKKIHVQVVVVQRIIDQVASKDSNGPS